MNHDYVHCVDWVDICPETCFRAQLMKDIRENLSEYLNVPLNWARLKDTDYCELKGENNERGN